MVKYLTILCVLVTTQFSQAQTTDLAIVIPNIYKVTGQIEVSLYDGPDHFLSKGHQFKSVICKVDQSSEKCIVEDIPVGEYAVALYFDENYDGELNLNFWGIPREAYGFSKNVKPIVKAPSYDECKIDVKNQKEIVIELIY